jgi:hypothetical protein
MSQVEIYCKITVTAAATVTRPGGLCSGEYPVCHEWLGPVSPARPETGILVVPPKNRSPPLASPLPLFPAVVPGQGRVPREQSCVTERPTRLARPLVPEALLVVERFTPQSKICPARSSFVLKQAGLHPDPRRPKRAISRGEGLTFVPCSKHFQENRTSIVHHHTLSHMCQPPATRDRESYQPSAGDRTCSARRNLACNPMRNNQIKIMAAFLICSSVAVCSMNSVTNQLKTEPTTQLRLRRCISLSSDMSAALAACQASRRPAVYSAAHSPVPELVSHIPRSESTLPCSPQSSLHYSDIPREDNEDRKQVYTRIQTQLFPYMKF